MLTPVRSALPALLLFGAAAGTAAALAPDDPPAATAQAAQLEDAFATHELEAVGKAAIRASA